MTISIVPYIAMFIIGLVFFWKNHQRGAPKAGGFCETKNGRPVEPKLLDCIRERRSIFPRSYIDKVIDRDQVELLLEAAMWAPFHGPRPPWRFVVLGRDAILEMQKVTLAFYDAHWTEVWETNVEYQTWRHKAEQDITDRWARVSYFIAIVMKRQSGSKKMPEWEEAAATACAVQNMHLQASASPGLACYWSSWHSKARDSIDMKRFLAMDPEDKCFGFFVVAACDPNLKDRRSRSLHTHMDAEWRE